MAKTFRIDSIKANPDGAIDIAYTMGQAPLPTEPSGSVMQFASKRDVVQVIEEAMTTLSERHMFALAAASVFKSDVQMKTLSQYNGKTVTIDMNGAAQAISLG